MILDLSNGFIHSLRATGMINYIVGLVAHSKHIILFFFFTAKSQFRFILPFASSCLAAMIMRCCWHSMIIIISMLVQQFIKLIICHNLQYR